MLVQNTPISMYDNLIHIERSVFVKKYTEIIKGLREDKDLRQIDIAKIIGTTQQHYSKYETGENELPLRVLSILIDYYNVSADYIMGRTECSGGIDVLNKKLTNNCTVGKFISDVYSLDDTGRRSVIEYVDLQKLKKKRIPAQ